MPSPGGMNNLTGVPDRDFSTDSFTKLRFKIPIVNNQRIDFESRSGGRCSISPKTPPGVSAAIERTGAGARQVQSAASRSADSIRLQKVVT